MLYLLEGLAGRGVVSRLATPPGSPLAAHARRLGVEVVPLRSRGDLDPLAVARLRDALLGGTDLLHLHTGNAHALGLLAAARLRPRPAVAVSRRVDFPPRGGLSRRFKYGGRVDRFLCVSARVAAVLREAGVAPERLSVVRSGIRIERFAGPGDPAGLRTELAIPMRAKLVGFVGALVGHKSPGDLLEALSRLPAGVHAALAGRGELEAALRARAGRPDLAGRVHFLGHREDVPRILRSVDVFCLPSRLEGLGTSVLDAMASEVPVVAAAAGGIPEMVEDGVSGLLVPPGDPGRLSEALSAVLSDPALAARLAAGGRARVEEFRAERMVEETLAVYREIVRNRK